MMSVHPYCSPLTTVISFILLDEGNVVRDDSDECQDLNFFPQAEF